MRSYPNILTLLKMNPFTKLILAIFNKLSTIVATIIYIFAKINLKK